MPRCLPGAASAVAEFRDYVIATKAPGERLREVDESSRQLNSAIDRASRFLNLASLASVLLAAVAVAMGARRYASRHIDAVALMKCMGASQRFVLAISIIELTLLALLGGCRRLPAGLSRAVGARLAVARFHPNRPSTRLARAACRSPWSPWWRCCIGFALAAVTAIEEHAARASPAQDRDRSAAALRLALYLRARGAVRDSLEPGARYGAGVQRARRRAGRRSRADAGGVRTGAPDGPPARRRGSGLALRSRQRLAPRQRQRRADRRLRPGTDDAAAARRGARRSARPIGGAACPPTCPTTS